MNTKKVKSFSGTPFTIETEAIVNEPGTWDSTKVSIFSKDVLIGEYVRNYSNSGIETFYPFLCNKEWYALYSANYTATRVMKLHDDRIEDWCGQDPKSNGFCPIEYYIPKYNHTYQTYDSGEKISGYDDYSIDNTMSDLDFLEEQSTSTFVKVEYCNFGFMSGCVWGDDSSCKLRYIDLSKIADKELFITERFGYWEIPYEMKLKKCIDMSHWEPDSSWIALTGMSHFHLADES